MAKSVLFVCVENACRSLMAEAIFNAAAPSGWVGRSAGTRPARLPNARTAPMLRELGLELPLHPPQDLTNDMIEGAAVRVTMGCLDDASCPANLSSRPLVDWGLPDPAPLDDAGFRQVRDDIEARIRELIATLPSGPE